MSVSPSLEEILERRLIAEECAQKGGKAFPRPNNFLILAGDPLPIDGFFAFEGKELDLFKHLSKALAEAEPGFSTAWEQEFEDQGPHPGMLYDPDCVELGWFAGFLEDKGLSDPEIKLYIDSITSGSSRINYRCELSESTPEEFTKALKCCELGGYSRRCHIILRQELPTLPQDSAALADLCLNKFKALIGPKNACQFDGDLFMLCRAADSGRQFALQLLPDGGLKDSLLAFDQKTVPEMLFDDDLGPLRRPLIEMIEQRRAYLS